MGGSLLSILEEFLTGRSQCVSISGCCGDSGDIVSGVPQGSVLGPLLFILYTSDLFGITDNTLIGYADDSSLLAVCRSPLDRVRVSRSIDCDLEKIIKWCNDHGMLINSGKTKSMIFSRSRTFDPPFPRLVVDGCELEDVDEVSILGVLFDKKLSFESHLRKVVAGASQKLGIMRRAWRVFEDREILLTCFRSFVLPLLEYCSPVWRSSADCHLNLLDRIIGQVSFLLGGDFVCDLWHRRDVAGLCMLYKVLHRDDHPLLSYVPPPYVVQRRTRFALERHSRCREEVRWRTSQFGRSFLPSVVGLWNSLDDEVFAGEDIGSFKRAVNHFLLH